MRHIILLLLILCPLTLFSENRKLIFSDPDINNKDQIILNVTNPSVSGETYTSLIRGLADGSHLEALTHFPDQSFYFPGRQEVLIYNHFGCYSYDITQGTWLDAGFSPQKSKTGALSPLALRPLHMSPDGRYALYPREDSDGSISLILFDRDLNVSFLVSTGLNRDYSQDLAKWSPQSDYFIYRRGQKLFYFSIDQYLSARIPAESFRNTGYRNIDSIQWGEGNYLYILRNSFIYRIHSTEFFTRSFYDESIKHGAVWGRIPVSFDPHFDQFSINQRATQILLVKNGNTAMVFQVQSGQNQSSSQTALWQSSMPIRTSHWLKEDRLLILSENILSQEKSVHMYINDEKPYFKKISLDSVNSFSPGPEGEEFALINAEGIDIYKSTETEPYKHMEFHQGLKLYWLQNSYIAMGRKTISLFGRNDARKQLIGISQYDVAGFNQDDELYCQIDENWYKYNEAYSWVKQDARIKLREPRLSNKNYRIYLEYKRKGWYDSSLKIRDISGIRTHDFIPPYFGDSGFAEPIHMKAESHSNPWYFDHGIRTEQKEIVLVFNCIDNAKGLIPLLDTLDVYGIQATFFLNGDFIHANPDETRMIAESEHNAGALFYTWFDMSKAPFQIDKSFLKKGIARNEDDYFVTTGRELDMLWHTPYYYINQDILETSSSMQYVFVGTDIINNDRIEGAFIPQDTFDGYGRVHQILEAVQPGSIIPMTVGKGVYQDEYVFTLLPLIIEELLRQGYSFVPLLDMMQTSR